MFDKKGLAEEVTQLMTLVERYAQIKNNATKELRQLVYEYPGNLARLKALDKLVNIYKACCRS